MPDICQYLHTNLLGNSIHDKCFTRQITVNQFGYLTGFSVSVYLHLTSCGQVPLDKTDKNVVWLKTLSYCHIFRDVCSFQTMQITNELQHVKTNKVACAPSKDSDQPGHPLCLIRVFIVLSMGS